MDRLDKMSVLSIVVLVMTATALIFVHSNSVESKNAPAQQRAEKRIRSPELDKKIKVASDLLTNNNLDKAELLINDLVAEHPYDGSPYILLGDLHVRKLKPIQAMLAYRNAVDLNPDYLDKKTPLFQGKKIKYTTKEAKAAIKRGLDQNPDDEDLREQRKTLYYMLRKIAGSCG